MLLLLEENKRQASGEGEGTVQLRATEVWPTSLVPPGQARVRSGGRTSCWSVCTPRWGLAVALP